MASEYGATVRLNHEAALWVGDGSLAQVLSLISSSVHGARCAVVVDENVYASWLGALLRGSSLSVITHPPAVTFERICHLAERFTEDGLESVIAIGGGGVIDLVKLAALQSGNSGFVPGLVRGAMRAGVVLPLIPEHPGIRVVAAPTTLGTGTESNSVAIVSSDLGYGYPQRTLISSVSIRPAESVIDPRLTATLSEQSVREGLLELFLRTLGSAGAPTTLPIADSQAAWLLTESARLLDVASARTLNSDERTHAALLSGESHVGWSMVGRGLSPSPLWILANELGAVLDERKIDSLVRLAPPVLSEVASGRGAWGSAGSIRQVLNMSALSDCGDFADHMRHLITGRWKIPVQPFQGNAGAVANTVAVQVERRWGGALPMMGQIARTDVARIIERALIG